MLKNYTGLKLIQTEGQNKTKLEGTQTEHPSARGAKSSTVDALIIENV